MTWQRTGNVEIGGNADIGAGLAYIEINTLVLLAEIVCRIGPICHMGAI